MAYLVVVRHGQSEWNKANKFTGWVDVELSERGIEEAKNAGAQLKDYSFDYAFTSGLKRAANTLKIILEQIGQSDIPLQADEALNERHYGDLQGKDKNQVREEFGEEQVHIWRRSYDIAPPNGESLKDTRERVIPFFIKNIQPKIQEGKNVILSAHGNSLRALIMHLENLSSEEILEREIATGSPIIYEIDGNMQIVGIKTLVKDA